MKQNLLMIAIAVLALLAGAALKLDRPTPPPTADQAPSVLNFAFPDLQGHMQNSQQWHGKILVINFWASWCEPCKEEIPAFIAWQQRYADQGLQFVGIAVDDHDAVQAFLQPLAINYPMLIAGDAGATLSMQLGDVLGVLPFSLIVDQQGGIVHRQLGILTEKELANLIEPLLTGK